LNADYSLRTITNRTQTHPFPTWSQAMAEEKVLVMLKEATNSYAAQPAFFKPIYLKYLEFLSGYFYEQTTFNFLLDLIRESDGDQQTTLKDILYRSMKTFLLPIRNGGSTNTQTYFMRQFPENLSSDPMEILNNIIATLNLVDIDTSFICPVMVLYDTTYNIK
jgi:hypothetical protein